VDLGVRSSPGGAPLPVAVLQSPILIRQILVCGADRILENHVSIAADAQTKAFDLLAQNGSASLAACGPANYCGELHDAFL
jgi:hypothetical protein